MPKYRIHQQSHIDDRTIEAGQEVTVDSRHVPGPHWEPLDDEAKEIALKAGVKFTGQVPDPTDKLSLQLADDLAKQGASADQIAAAITRSLAPLLEKLTPAAVDEEAMQKRIDEAVERAFAAARRPK